MSDVAEKNELLILAELGKLGIKSKPRFASSVAIFLSIYFFGILKCDPFPALMYSPPIPRTIDAILAKLSEPKN